ncbi:MAG TPA: class I SAM-dependent methyltransferase [Gemmatimonadaceae bacterium]
MPELFGRLFTDPDFAYDAIRRRLRLTASLGTEDRRVLEQIIFPDLLADPAIGAALFVGCDWYTKQYERLFSPKVDYWTIDPDPARRKFGAKQHVIAPLEEVERHFPTARFDLIICNGVYGWGLDGRAASESAFAQCHACLRTGGLFMLGWDDLPARTPVPLEELASLRLFAPSRFPALDSWRYLTDTPYRHTYAFYRK